MAQFKLNDRVQYTGTIPDIAGRTGTIKKFLPDRQITVEYDQRPGERALDNVWIHVDTALDDLVLVGEAPSRGGGQKFDEGKPQTRLFFEGLPLALTECMEVMSNAVMVKGYKPGSWKDVPNMEERYADALYRHYLKRVGGEDRDKESKLKHRAHEIINQLFLLEAELAQEVSIAKQEA